MKRITLFLLMVCLSAFSNFNLLYSQSNKLIIYGSDDDQKESTDYKNRVLQDNGFIQSFSYLDDFVKKSKNNYLDDIAFWVSSEWGLKLDGDKVNKLYDLKENDLTSPDLTSSPTWIDNEIFGKKGILFSGEKQYSENDSLFCKHPLTLILVFQQTQEFNKECLLDSKSKKEHSILFDDVSIDPAPLSIEIGKKIDIAAIREDKSFIYFELDGNNSKVYNNGIKIFEGEIPSGEFNGIRLGSLKNLHKNFFFSGYIFEVGLISKILTADQRNSLIDFIKNHYSIN